MWWCDSILCSQTDNCNSLSAIPSIVPYVTPLQRKTELELRRLFPREVIPTAVSRLRKLDPQLLPDQVDFVLFFFTAFWRAAPSVPPSVLTSLPRAMCNAWCTIGWFRSEARKCSQCGVVGGDQLRQLIECLIFDAL
eukprot:5113926-Pyramimonas_sp.AAC.1